METCIYKVDYVYHSLASFAFDNQHAIAYVEAPKNIFPWVMEKIMHQKFDRCWKVNSFEKIEIVKLVA